jgi:hypothetical protein
MDTQTTIRPEWFYRFNAEKIKLNWFLYEVALEYQSHIKKNKALTKFREELGEKAVADFCAYFAKRMKESVLDQLDGVTAETILYEEYFSDYFHGMDGKLKKLLNQTAEEAWDSHLSVCETCPSRCLSEKELPSPFFDKYKD